MVVGTATQFGFNGMKLPGAGSFQVVLFAISQDDSLVLVRVTPPRQNVWGFASSPALLFVRALRRSCFVRRKLPERSRLFSISCHVALVFCKCSGKSVTTVVIADKEEIVS